MKKWYIILGLFIFTTLCISCESTKKKRPVYNDIDIDSSEEEYGLSDDEVIVPFRIEGGVKYIPVSVNGVEFEMIFDTGCSETLITAAEANYLYQKGKLTKEDIQGTTSSKIADGSIVENMIVTLKEVVIADKIICPNVTACVVNNMNGPLLLGNAVLDRLATVVIDNENQNIIFKLK